MNQATADALREEIGYVEKVPTCGRCRHFQDVEHPVLDRSWIPSCMLFAETIGSMQVEKDGGCRQFMPKAGEHRL